MFTDVIADKFSIRKEGQPKLLNYISKCLRFCWMMTLHPKPVFIKFMDEHVSELLFDKDVFMPFETSGRYIDYILWPPLYAHECGEMLAQGTAKGKH